MPGFLLTTGAFTLAATAALAGLAVKHMPTAIDVWHSKPYDALRQEDRGDETGVPATMRAVVYDKHSVDGASSVLRLVPDHPRPVLQDHQLLVKVSGCSLNPVDFKFIRGMNAPRFLIPKPKIPGLDVAGTVVAVGKDVNSNDNGWKVGDRVAAMVPQLMTPWGGLAEYVAVDASLMARVPDIDNDDDEDEGNNKNRNQRLMEQAASFPLVATTVVQAFENCCPAGSDSNVCKGKKVLIQAGAGGVGTFAIQYAKRFLEFGTVATTASGPKAGFLRTLGADLVIDYRTENFEDVVRDYDVVLDPMSWMYENRTLSSGVLKPTGHYLKYVSANVTLCSVRSFSFVSFSLTNHKQIRRPSLSTVSRVPIGSCMMGQKK